jgi:predicted MFS family arabinose efflux permease
MHASPIAARILPMPDHTPPLRTGIAPTGIAPAGNVPAGSALLRNLVIGLTAFLTLVDLFATQAILPALVAHYGVSRAAMGSAVNASTFGMAVSGLLVALFSRRLPRRWGIIGSLALLSIPTAWLATAPDLAAFTALRIAQGVFMAAAFTLMLAHLGEQGSAADSAAAFAAYITGNVASNLFGRLFSAALADHLGLAANFYVFAALNLAGAVLVFFSIKRAPRMQPMAAARVDMMHRVAAWTAHLVEPRLRAAFAIGFCILFAFIGTFTYVNFVLVEPPLNLSQMSLGYVYFVFLPSMLTTPQAGMALKLLGLRRAFVGGLAIAVAGLPLLLAPTLPPVLAGLALVAMGTFGAQAIVTGFVSRAAERDRAAASGLYLASYFSGGLVGSVVVGRVFETLGWPAAVMGIGVALLAAACLARWLVLPAAVSSSSPLAGSSMVSGQR